MRSFLGFGQAAYIGQPQTFPMKVAGIKSVVVPLLFQWLSYLASSTNPNINVLVSLDVAPCRALDQIRSIYIDNLGSDNPVYVTFPDTNYTVVAKPNSEGWYPVFTNGKTFWVVGEGFLTGDIPQTFILVSNVREIPYVNTELDQAKALWLASPVISRGNSIFNSSLGVPALADQFLAVTLTLTVGQTQRLWGTPYVSGFLIVNALFINSDAALAVAAGQAAASIAIESTGIAGNLVDPTIAFFQNTIPKITPLVQDANLKLDATQTWQARVLTASNISGSCQILTAFVQQ